LATENDCSKFIFDRYRELKVKVGFPRTQFSFINTDSLAVKRFLLDLATCSSPGVTDIQTIIFKSAAEILHIWLNFSIIVSKYAKYLMNGNQLLLRLFSRAKVYLAS
jgi:hypothetical protein